PDDRQPLVLEHGPLRVEITLRPFAFTVRRAGRRLLRSGGVWVADGTVHDHFVALTEGVLANEDRSPLERAASDEIGTPPPISSRALTLALRLDGGRRAQLSICLSDPDRVSLALAAQGDPLRLAIDWDRRSGERLIGLGARHGTQLDQVGRDVQLGADRRYTGPDCPPD